MKLTEGKRNTKDTEGVNARVGKDIAGYKLAEEKLKQTVAALELSNAELEWYS